MDVAITMMDKIIESGSRILRLHKVLAEPALHNQPQRAFVQRIAKYLPGMGGRPRGPLGQEEVVISKG